jgi:hypothetical protein
MGIDVYNNHAVIYPHYKDNWKMKISPYQKLKPLDKINHRLALQNNRSFYQR